MNGQITRSVIISHVFRLAQFFIISYILCSSVLREEYTFNVNLSSFLSSSLMRVSRLLRLFSARQLHE